MFPDNEYLHLIKTVAETLLKTRDVLQALALYIMSASLVPADCNIGQPADLTQYVNFALLTLRFK